MRRKTAAFIFAASAATFHGEWARAEDDAAETPDGASDAAAPGATNGGSEPIAEQDPPNGEAQPRKSLARVPSARPTSGGPPPPTFGTFEGTYALGGMGVGATLGPAALVLGTEFSVVRQMREFAWWGGYLDAAYDFGREQVRLSIGPEFGWSALGLDAGYLLALDDRGTRGGVTVRPLLTIGYLAAYGRVSHLFSGETWAEGGLLVKYVADL